MYFSVRLSSAWLYIAFTYLLALFPLTVLTNLYFISSDWRTLKATRTSGWYHFYFVVIPIPIIICYIVVFWSAMDYPESCAAFLGLYVLFVHFLRTSLGLCQIYLFRSWAIGAIESMEEMGYKYKLQIPMKRKIKGKENGKENKKKNKKSKKKTNTRFINEPKTAEEKAEIIFVNNTIIDDQLFYGKTRWYLQYRGKMYCSEKDPYGDKSFFKRWIEALCITVQIPFLPLLWTFDLVRYEIERVWMEWIKIKTGNLGQSEKFRQSRHRILLLPFEPVDLWLRWSTVFAAQGLNEWIEEFEVAQDPDMKEKKIEDEEELYKARRDYFAGELLSGMSHLSDVKSDKDKSSMSILWDEKSGIRDGTIKKWELLRAARESGRGLPFGARQIIGEGDVKREIVEGLEEGEEFVGYREYKRKLEGVKESLPVQFGGGIREFDVERLEWLTILLYVGDMTKDVKKGKKNMNNKKENSDKSDTDTSVESDGNEFKDDVGENSNRGDEEIQDVEEAEFNGTRNEKEERRNGLDLIGSNHEGSSSYKNALNRDVGMRDVLGDEYLSVGSQVCPDERYMPFRNLMSQLGFTIDLNSIHTSPNSHYVVNEKHRLFRKICSFALNKSFTSNICMIVSRTNRHVLRIGEMSDIWIQLEAGKHYKFLQEKNEWWRTACLGTTIQEDMNTKLESGSDADIDGYNKIGNIESSDQHSQRKTFNNLLRERQERAELSRLSYQLGDGDQKYLHLEQSLSFMGYGMEFVRSELGHWVSDRNAGQDMKESWRPKIGGENSRISNSVGVSIGLLSSSLSDSIVRNDLKLMHQRRFQVRLLWEIQQLLEEKVKIETEKGGGGPDSEAMIMHCILGFPALIVEIDDCDHGNSINGTNLHNEDNQRDHRENEVSVKNDKNGNCMIRFQPQQDKKTITTKSHAIQQQDPTTMCNMLKIHVRPQCGPQDLHLWIHLNKNDNCRVHVTAGIRLNETEPDEIFEWEWWRDSFCSRLQGTTKWQQRHQFPFVECEDTTDSINKGIENMKISEIGTGERLRVWKGWRPFRESICRFELETPGYILENKKTEQMRTQWYFPAINISTEFKLNRIEQVPVPYDRARWRELHTCFLSMKEILEQSSHRQSTTDNIGEQKFAITNDEVVSNSERVHMLLRNGQEGAERAVLLLQETALKDHDQNSLHQCLQLMTNGIHMPKDLGGAIDLLHRFLTFGEGRRSHQEIVDRLQCLTETAVEHTTHLWRDENRRKDLFKVLQLLCVVGIGINKIDEVAMKRLDWLLGMLRARVMRHRDTSTLRFLAEAEGQIWMSKVSQLRAKGKARNEKRTVWVSWEVGKEREDLNAYLESCAIYRRAIKEADGTEHQSDLLNDFALQLQNGINGEYKDVSRAVGLYQRAIYAGNPNAMNNLAIMLQHGAEGVDKAPPTAQRFYQRAIDAGNADAMNNLALMLEDGAKGVEKGPQTSQHLYQSAIDAGNAHAMNNLAFMLQHGAEGVEKDPETARHLYRRAIDAGNPNAINNLAFMLQHGAGVEKDPQAAQHLYRRAINAGSPNAVYNLACMLQHGAEGVEKDPQAARHLYQRAIDAGDLDAMSNLACMLTDGAEGVEKDPQEAVQLYEKVIEQQQDTAAMNNLALIFHYGAYGVQVDLQRANLLYQQAIELGNEPESMYHRACLLHHSDNTVVQKDVQKAKELYQRAITEAKDVDAMFALAKLLEEGDDGVAKEPKQAVELYYSLIVNHEHEEALYRISKLLEHGSEEPNGLEADGKRAVALYEKAMEGKLSKIASEMLGRLLDRGCAGVAVDKERAAQLLGNADDGAQDERDGDE